MDAVVMSLLAVVSVGLWTLRVALAAHGRRLAGAAVAAVEAVVFALAFSTLVADLGSWDRVAGYALGVAAGTIAGLVINDRLNPGGTVIEIIVPGDGEDLRRELHSRGWPATTMPAAGVRGAVTVLILVTPAAVTTDVERVIEAVAPDAFWTKRPATTVHWLADQDDSEGGLLSRRTRPG